MSAFSSSRSRASARAGSSCACRRPTAARKASKRALPASTCASSRAALGVGPHLRDRRLGVAGLPARGPPPRPRRSRPANSSSPSALEPALPRPSALRRPATIGLEEALLAGQRVPAHAGLLVEQRRGQVAGGDRRRAEPVGQLDPRVAEVVDDEHVAHRADDRDEQQEPDRAPEPLPRPQALLHCRCTSSAATSSSIGPPLSSSARSTRPVTSPGAPRRGRRARRAPSPAAPRRRAARRRRRCGPRSGRRCRAAATSARAARARARSSAASSTTPSGGSTRSGSSASIPASESSSGGGWPASRIDDAAPVGRDRDHAERREHPRRSGARGRARAAASAAAPRPRGRRARACATRSAGRRRAPPRPARGPTTSPITACTAPARPARRRRSRRRAARAGGPGGSARRAAGSGSVTSGAGSRPRSRRAFSSACSARDLELLAGLVGAPALDRVADRARQPLAVDLALDQVVLRAGADRLHARAARRRTR